MWQYTVLERGPGTAPAGQRVSQGRRGVQLFEDVLNDLGRDSWELVLALPSTVGNVLVFKRWFEPDA